MAESAMPDHCHFSTGSVVPPTHLKSPGIIASSGERSEKAISAPKSPQKPWVNDSHCPFELVGTAMSNDCYPILLQE
jgi:hypothetical protein